MDRIGLRGISASPDRRLRHSRVGCLVVQAVPLAAGRRDRQAAGERLRHAGEDTPLLHDDEHRHQHPPPVDPSHACEPGAGHAIEGIERRAAPRQRRTTDLDLGRHLDGTAEDDQPEQHEARLGADDRGCDQFAAAHDGTGQNDPRTKVRE